MVDILFLKVGLVNEDFARSLEYGFSGSESDLFKGIDDPAFDLVIELVDVDVFFCDLFFGIAVYVDLISGELGGEFYVGSTFADCERYFFGAQEYFCFLPD